MSLDRRVFLREMALLAERFNRPELSEPLIARYYDTLNGRLTTPDFERAARAIFDGDTFWPAPLRFVEVVQGNPKAMADDAWTRLLQAMRSGRPHDAPAEAIATLRRSGATFRDLMEATEYRLTQLERGFKSAYAAPNDARALPEPTKPEPLAIEGFGA